VKDIEIDETEEFQYVGVKRKNGHPFPAATFNKYQRTYVLNFNALASQPVTELEKVNILVSDKHILFSPPLEYGRRWRVGHEYNYRRVCCKALSEYLTEGETYRAYPYKGGLAIDREPIEEDAK
jgi:hypothetical protein